MNSVNIIGRLNEEPKLLQTKTGRDILRFVVKIERHTNSGDDVFEHVDYIPCFAVDQKAVAIANGMRKGHRIAITGHLQSYIRMNGANVETGQIEVYVDRYDFMTPRMPKCSEQSA